jgi:hypothetical protein
VKPAKFTIPFGPVVPIVALIVTAGVLIGATRVQLIVGGLALLAGAVMFAVRQATAPVRQDAPLA